MMEALKNNHEGKRVNDGNSFDPDRYNYIAYDGTMYGMQHLQAARPCMSVLL